LRAVTDTSTIMRRRFTRYLVLACSLLLALPPGWCCLLEAHTFGEIGKKRLRTCAACCCKDTAKGSETAPDPSAPRPPRCPCDDRNSTSPDSAAGKSAGAAVLPIAFGAAGLRPLTPVGDGLPLLSFPAGLDTSLHLLHCIWLC
jgi:hypothetical protein